MPKTVLGRAADGRLPINKLTDPGITVQAIWTRQEAMRDHTRHGRTSWPLPTVKMLLERIEHLGSRCIDFEFSACFTA